MRIVALIIILLTYPALVAWLRANPRKMHWAYFGLGLLPFMTGALNLDASIISWPTWSGYAKGLVITVEDTLALAIVTVLRKPRGMPPLIGFFALYLVAVTMSVSVSNIPTATWFYVFQVLRMILLFWAVAKIAGNDDALRWLAMGLAAGVSYQAGMCIWQKAGGAFQTPGTMGHQNLLGMMSHFVMLPLLAMLLGGVRSRLMMLGVFSSLIVVALGASRGTVGFSLMGVAALIALSIYRRSTPHKWRMVGFAALALAVTSPFIYQGMEKRFIQLDRATGGYDERAAFERAAKLMFADHPMGVGANQYIVVANTQGYSSRGGVTWSSGSLSTNVHNLYLLAAAETGWIGRATLMLLFAAIIFAGLRFAFQSRRDPRGDIVLGATVAVAVTAAHSLYEWIWVTFPAQYVFVISAGIISGLMRSRAFERKRPRATQPPLRSQPDEELSVARRY